MRKRTISEAAVTVHDVITIRNERVLVDAVVAKAFGTETRQVNQAVSRNPDKFSEEHCFQLTKQEHEDLKSQSATPDMTAAWGGRRYPPRMFTIKGVARLATLLNTPAALRATDLIIDTFLVVQEQLSAGKNTVTIPEPDRYQATPEDRAQIRKLRKRLTGAVEKLLDTMIDPDNEQTLKDASKKTALKALTNVHERLRTKGLENAKLEADSSLVLAQAEKVLAEARKTHAEADGLDIDNLEKRIAAVRRIAGLIDELEPPAVISLIEDFEAAPLRLESDAAPKN